jgi:hypothetical protein
LPNCGHAFKGQVTDMVWHCAHRFKCRDVNAGRSWDERLSALDYLP